MRLASRLALILALIFAIAAPSSPSHARPELSPRALDQQLAELPLGKNRAALASWLKARFERRYLPIIAGASEFAEKERLRAQRERELAEVLAGEVAFEGTHTSWDVSIIAGEYASMSGESVLVWRDDGAIHFFFLIGGVFWKYARQLDPAPSFDDRVAEWTGKHGAAHERLSEVEVLWKSGDLQLRLLNRRILYGGDLALLESAELARGVERKRAQTAHKRAGDRARDTSLDDFLLPDNER